MLHDRFLLPHFVWEDFCEILAEMAGARMRFEREWFAPHFEFRFPKIGEVTHQGVSIELRTAIEPWYVLGEEPGGGGTVRFVDSSVERLQVLVSGLVGDRFIVTCNGRARAAASDGGRRAIRGGGALSCLAAAQLSPSNDSRPYPSRFLICLTAGPIDHSEAAPITWPIPRGADYETFPVNSYEAEARRAARFFKMGHTPGGMMQPARETNPAFPCTLDLRRTPQNL